MENFFGMRDGNGINKDKIKGILAKVALQSFKF